MKQRCLQIQLALIAMLLSSLTASAVSGHFTDPGGGSYWCNVYVASVSSGKSYSWCTGKGEESEMNNFRGFESENGGVLSAKYPTVKIKFRFHYHQAKDFNRNGSKQEIYVMTTGGTLHKIGEWPRGGNFTQTDYTYGVLGEGKMDGDWISFRYTPNQEGLNKVTAIQIENDTYYHQSNFWISDYDFTIHARYLKGLRMDFEKCQDVNIQWYQPGKVKLTSNNSWLTDPLGENVSLFTYKSNYKVNVMADGKNVNSYSYSVSNKSQSTVELNVPIDKDFNLEVVRNTTISYTYNNRTISLNLNDNEKTVHPFNNTAPDVTASFNQVTREMRLQWPVDNKVASEGKFQIYRTLMNEYGSYVGKREKLVSTSDNYFVDNAVHGLEYNCRYRYEVFQLKNVWSELEIPENPDPLTVVNPAIVETNTIPVIPLTLKQDESVTDNIKIDWSFNNVPQSENEITFNVHRTDPDGTIRTNYGEVTVSRSTGQASFVDDKPASSCEVYSYRVTADILDGKQRLTSDVLQSSLLDKSIVTGVTISKGNYMGSVHVNWTAKQVGTNPTYYEVQRRFIGASDWLTISSTTGTGNVYTYVDQAAEPGRFYEYRVVAYTADCEGTGQVISNAVTESGFSQASGVIAGRVHFDTGTAVEGVRLNLLRNGDENTRPQFYSRAVLDTGGGMEWHTDAATANSTLRLDRPFTLQMWVKPEEDQQWVGLFKIDNYDGYSHNAEGHATGYNFGLFNYDHNRYGGDHDGFALMLKFSGTEKWFENPRTGAYGVIEYNQYSHLTIRNNCDGTISFIINGDVENPYILDINQYSTLQFDTSEIPADDDGVVKVKFCSTYGGNHHNTLKGNIDEVRVWNRALPDKEVVSTFDRLLSGRESGLKLYWTFDEGLEEYAFDYSYTDGVPNGNHPILGRNTRPSEIVPSEQQLSLYGITNENGEYIIRGIPFTGSGTGYTVAPSKGIHQFNPTSRTGFVSANSLSLNGYDFTDESSFKVRGTILYTGTTIPVDSVSFYIDGTPCNKNDKLIYSDSNGEYEISVPIGSHYIEARRSGHVFEGKGRYPVDEEETYEFVADTHLDFYDNTLVTLAGRIVGGNTEGDKPLGYGESVNNIGKAVIQLTPLDHPQRMLNAVKKVDGVTVEWLPNPENVEVESSTADINSISYRAGGDIDDVKYIYITTDENTGEFCAKLPPLRYKVQSVQFPNNSRVAQDEMFQRIAAINCTNPNDTIIPDTLYTVNKEPLPLFKCNSKLMLTYRSNPVMDITQVGAPAGAFGTDSITVTDNRVDIKLPIYNHDSETGTTTYNYTYPIFQSGRSYEFKIKAYEPYFNYDKDTAGHLYQDLLRDSVVTVDNELGDGAMVCAVDTVADGHSIKRGDLVKLEKGQVQLDSIGEGRYKWTAGVPSLTAPYTRSLNASMVINGQTRLWSNDGLTAIIAGVVPTGNNFITAGPSYVQMVLRDPPGDASSATWGTDTITTKYSYRARGIHNKTDIGVEIHTSLEIDVGVGLPTFMKFTYNNIIHENGGHWTYDVNKTWDNRSYTTYTNSNAITTNSTGKYVGRDGDVFVGYSTNYIIGAADKVGLFKQEDGTWAISTDEVITMDEKFNTHFEYSQKYIEGPLFNNIKRTRNAKLQHIKSKAEIEDNPPVPTYYTLLSENDPNYGRSNDDEVWGDAAESDPLAAEQPSYYFRYPDGYAGCDSVRWCNQIIKLWEKTLADNEEDKLKAFANATKYLKGNESFETGAAANFSSMSTHRSQHNSVQNFSTSVGYKGKNGLLFDKMGFVVNTSTDIGYHETLYDVDETTTQEKFSYNLYDTQRNNAHTVDIYESPIGWGPIFRTRGGQTRCPHEDATFTKYYKKGTQLDYATMKSDNPKLTMLTRNFVGIPAGQSANIPFTLSSESETHEQFSSVILYVLPQSNTKGLQVLYDGKPMIDGTEVWLEYGVPVNQQLTVVQSDQSILDYEDIELQIHSACSNLGSPNDLNAGLVPFESTKFSVHFVPSAPPVTLHLDKDVLNMRSLLSNEQVAVTISDISRQFNGLKGVRLKYRFAGDSQWITAHEWLTSEEYFTAGASETQSLLPAEGNINYNLALPGIDGNYVVAAESMAMFGTKEVFSVTPEQSVIRDTRGPKLLGQAYPNTGILTPTDDIRIKFNEDIRESYLTKESNFFITGSLNDAQVSHDVSLQFNGTPVETDAYLPVANTSIASTLWLKRKSGGTILEHGTEGNMLKVAINDRGQVEASINGNTLTSDKVVPTDKWVFLALNYVKGSAGSDNTLTMLMAEDDNETMLFDEAIVPDYNANGRLTLGRDFTGMMHELVLWNKNCPVRTLLAQKDEVVAPYLPGLVGYWKMNEGHGTTVTDYARSRNIHLPAETWNVENTNLAAHLDGQRTIKIPIGGISPQESDSYVVETWFRGEKGKNARATLLSVTDRVSIGFDYDNSMILHLYNDTLSSLNSNGLPIVLTNVDYNDGNWHHLALNVHRGVSAVVYIDGKPVKTLSDRQLPAAAGDYLYVGGILKLNSETNIISENYRFTGDIDELRIWNVACDGTSVIANRYNQVDTANVAGLVAYYPMEHSSLDANGNIVTEFSLVNNAPGLILPGMGEALCDGVTKAATAPALRKAPLRQNLDFDFTASSNEIFINLNTLPSRMQGNLLTFIVKNVRDMQDNLSETITWSAVVDYNTLNWDHDELSVEKDRLSEAYVWASLHNKGRESGRFNISGLPNWIVPSVATGVLGTNEWTSIMFTIGADAPVGTHNIYVYAVNEDDICAPLMLRVSITGNDPKWSVNPADFESSMNLTGQIYFDDKICTNPNTRIAAFVDGTCCGVASPKLVTSRDAYFVNMTVYGVEDITKDQPIIFRIYDAEKGVVLGNVVTKHMDKTLNITYKPNDLIGDYDNPVVWLPSDQIEQLCSLQTGWNWISFYVKPEENKADLESVFGHNKVFNTIKSKEGFAMNSGSKWTSTGLDSVDVGKLYKLKMKADFNHSVIGSMIDTRTATQTIYPGWNWIGPLSIYNLSLNEAFADLMPTRGDIVKSKNQVAFYDGYKWEGELTALIPGMGYYYKSFNDHAVTFRYPTVDATIYQAPAMVMLAPMELPFTPVDHHQFSDNMNVVARVMVDGVEADNLCVAAFVDDECRGVTTATNDGLYLLTIAGNADETGKNVRFATVYNGETVWFNEELQWQSDWIYGDLDEPQLLHLKISGIDDVTMPSSITISPAVVTDIINVRAGDILKSVKVFSVAGQLLQSFTPDDNQAAYNLSHLTPGVYIVEARTHSGAHAIKQIIKR